MPDSPVTPGASEGFEPTDARPAESLGIEHLYDIPQDQWGVEQWRELALYQHKELSRTTAELTRATAGWAEASSGWSSCMEQLRTAHEEVRRLSTHSRFLRLVEREITAGRVKIEARPPRKKAGRPRKLTGAEQRKLDQALVARASQEGTRKAAVHFAAQQMRDEGLDPSRHTIKLRRYTKTWENEVAKAKGRRRRDIVARLGLTLDALDLQHKEGVLGPKRKNRTPKNPA